MSEEHQQRDDSQRLSQINTLWSVVRRAHGSETAAAHLAKQHLIDRYGTAIRRYLVGALRDEAAAEEVYQNFVVQFLEGRLASADQQRGRFRNFLKTVLSRSVAEYHRRRGRDRLRQPSDTDLSVTAAGAVAADDHAFDHSWRSTLLARTWDALAANERDTGRPVYSILRARVEHPDASSTELADELSERLGRTLTGTHLRVWLHRSRETFARLLVGEVEQSLETTSRDEVEEELSELELLEYCRGALEKHGTA